MRKVNDTYAQQTNGTFIKLINTLNKSAQNSAIINYLMRFSQINSINNNNLREAPVVQTLCDNNFQCDGADISM